MKPLVITPDNAESIAAKLLRSLNGKVFSVTTGEEEFAGQMLTNISISLPKKGSGRRTVFIHTTQKLFEIEMTKNKTGSYSVNRDLINGDEIMILHRSIKSGERNCLLIEIC